MQVVEKFVLQLEAQLLDRGVTIELTKKAAEWLADKGYDDKMGARPLGRVIQEHIKKPLAEELLFGQLEHGGAVKVIVEEGEEGAKKLGFEFFPADARIDYKIVVDGRWQLDPGNPAVQRSGFGDNSEPRACQPVGPNDTLGTIYFQNLFPMGVDAMAEWSAF